MKINKILFTALAVWVANFSTRAGEHSSFGFYLNGKWQQLNRVANEVVVEFYEPVSLETKRAILSDSIIIPITTDNLLPLPEVTVAKFSRDITDEEFEKFVSKLCIENAVKGVHPVFYSEGMKVAVYSRFLVMLKKVEDLPLLQQHLESKAITSFRQNDFDSRLYEVTCNKNVQSSVLDHCTSLFETGLFAFAEPDFIVFGESTNTNDPQLFRQWWSANEGSNSWYSGCTRDADIDLYRAWGESTGSAGIKVAVLDDGVDLLHPDLNGNLLPGYCALTPSSLCNSNKGMHTSWTDRHGTPCAGLIAAKGNNNTGGAGVAYNSKVIPVVMAYKTPSQYAGAGWTSTDLFIANSINWAWKNGTHILSCSFKSYSSNVLNTAIDSAVIRGRGGKGCLIFVSSGNDNSNVGYPATNSKVIAVGATDCKDDRAGFSNWGTGLDIVAPGVATYATDRRDTSGFSASDYTNFGGTSAACPVAAGVGALVLSINPSLTLADARLIIERSCEKVGGYNYFTNTAQPSSTWSNYTGYGRVNAYAATLMAKASMSNTGAVFVRKFPVSLCKGESFEIEFYNNVNFGTSNLFVAELSSPAGNFSTTTTIGIIGAPTSNYAKITCTIPTAIASSSFYRIRVRALSPSTASNASSAISIGINYCSLSVSHNLTYGACGGTPVTLQLQPVGSIPIGTVFRVLLQNGAIQPPGSVPVLHTFTYNGTNSITFSLPNSMAPSVAYSFQLQDVSASTLSSASSLFSIAAHCSFCSPVPKVLQTNCGTILDGSGVSNYQSNTVCRWLIQPTGANAIQLQLSYLNTESGYDKILVYNGPTSSSPLLASWSGTALPPAVTGNQSSMLVVFITDGTNNMDGFIADYSVVTNTPTSVSLSSITNFNQYATSVHCPQKPIVINGTLAGSTCIPAKYYVELSDTNGSFTNPRIIDSVNLSSGTVSVTYTISPSITPSVAYKIRLRNVNSTVISNALNLPINTSCQYCLGSISFTGVSDTIYDGSYESPYVPNASGCTWKIDVPGAQRIVLYADSVELAMLDTLYIYRGHQNVNAQLVYPLNGVSYGSVFTLDTSRAMLFFAPNFSANGFKVHYSAIGIEQPFTPTRLCSLSGADSFSVRNIPVGNFPNGTFFVELSNASGSFSSPIIIGSTTNSYVSFVNCSIKNLSLPPGAGYRIRIRHSSTGLISPLSNPIEIQQMPSFNIVVSPPQICSEGDSAIVSVSTPMDAYNWSDGSVASSVWYNSPGSYSVILVYGECYTEHSFDILQSPTPTISASIDSTLCSNSTEGRITTSVSGLFPFYYGWSTGDTSAVIQDLRAGYYELTVTDALGCITVERFEVGSPTEILPEFVYARPSTIGGSDGEILARASGGNSPYVFDWSNGASTDLITALTAGNYTVTVTDINLCTAEATAELFDPIPPLSAEIKLITCDTNNLRLGLFDAPVTDFNAIHFTPGENADGHIVEFSLHPAFTPVLDTAIVIGDSTVLLKSVDSLEVGGMYFVRVRSFNTSGFGPYSNTCFISLTPEVIWYGTFDNDWNNADNWSGGQVPDCNTTVVIPLSNVPHPVVNSPAYCGDIKIDNSVSIQLNADLQVCGNWVGSSIASVVSGSGFVVFNGPATQTFSGNTQFYFVRLNNASGLNLQASSFFDVFVQLDLQSGNLNATNGQLRLLSTSTTHCAIINDFSPLTYNGTLSGNIIAQRYIGGSGNVQHQIGSPLSNIPFAQLGASGTAGNLIPTANCDETQSAGNSPYGNVFQWNETTPTSCILQGWEVKVGGNTQNARGYSVYLNGGTTLNVNGAANLNPSYVTPSLTNSSYSLPTLQSSPNYTFESGWHLLSNPFPSGFTYNAQPGFNALAYVYVPAGPFSGTYQPLSPGDNVAPFQGIMVNVNAGTPAYSFDRADRTTNSSIVFYQNTNAETMSIEVSGNGFADKTQLSFNAQATTQHDADFDLRKQRSNLGQPTVFTNHNSYPYAVNTLKSIEETSAVPLGIIPGANGIFSFTFNGIQSFDPTTYIYLEDKLTGAYQNLRNNNTYSFNMTSMEDVNRFVLHFTPPAQFASVNETCEETGVITVEQPGSAFWQYNVVNAQQITIATGILNQSQPVSITVGEGIYQIKLQDNEGYTVERSVLVEGVQILSATMQVSLSNQLQASTVICETGQAVTFCNATPLYTAGSACYWNFGDGTGNIFADSITHAFTSEGVYNTTMTVISNDSCISATSREIIVTPAMISGEVEVLEQHIKIWSHRNNYFVDLRHAGDEQSVVRVYDALGRLLEEERPVAQQLFISSIPNVNYETVLISVSNAKGVKTQRVLLRKD